MLYCRRCKCVNTVKVGKDDNGDWKTVTKVIQSRMYVDRVFSENKNYEVACLTCGVRRFINKGTVFGRWLEKRESLFEAGTGGAFITSS